MKDRPGMRLSVHAPEAGTGPRFSNGLRAIPLEIGDGLAYMSPVTSVTMAINGVWNKRCGPGGGTRRLHHSPLRRAAAGAKQDRRGRKGCFFARHDTAVIGSNLIVANDNYAPVAVAA